MDPFKVVWGCRDRTPLLIYRSGKDSDQIDHPDHITCGYVEKPENLAHFDTLGKKKL
jgi:hypothetical protein